MSTEQLERETEATRAQLAQTLDELRTMSPGRVLDEVLDYAKEGGGEFVRNFGRQITNHPLPATLIGAGIVWFMMDGKANGSSVSGGVRRELNGMSDTAESAMKTGPDMADRAGEALTSTAAGIQSAAGSFGHAAASAAHTIGDATSSAYEAVSETAGQAASAVKNAASSLMQSSTAWEEGAVARGRSVMDFCMGQPLLLAGIGLAIGAALGAAIPETKAEDELMGEAADAVKQSARQIASEQLDAAKTAGEHAIDETAKLVSEKVADVADRLENQVPSDDQQSAQSKSGGAAASLPWEQQHIH